MRPFLPGRSPESWIFSLPTNTKLIYVLSWNLSSREPTYIMNYKVISSQSTKLLEGAFSHTNTYSLLKRYHHSVSENKIFTQVSGRISGSVMSQRLGLWKQGESYYHYIKCIWRAGFWSKQTRTMSWLAPGPHATPAVVHLEYHLQFFGLMHSHICL